MGLYFGFFLFRFGQSSLCLWGYSACHGLVVLGSTTSVVNLDLGVGCGMSTHGISSF